MKNFLQGAPEILCDKNGTNVQETLEVINNLDTVTSRLDLSQTKGFSEP